MASFWIFQLAALFLFFNQISCEFTSENYLRLLKDNDIEKNLLIGPPSVLGSGRV